MPTAFDRDGRATGLTGFPIIQIIQIGLILVLWLGCLVPIADRTAVERVPGHLHLLVGVNPSDWVAVLARHRHDADLVRVNPREARHPAGAATDRRADDRQIVSLRTLDGIGATVLGDAGLALLSPVSPFLGPSRHGARVDLISRPIAGTVLPVPKPPPRPAF